MLRYYVPEIAKIFRIEPMPRNRVQHQKGLSDDAFERLYPDEKACRKAWFAWRWPEGFKCPRCAGLTYCEIRGRQLLQCRQCRHQTSLIAGTVLQGTKLPMRVWFRAKHLLAQGKRGLSNIELGRRLGISSNAACATSHSGTQPGSGAQDRAQPDRPRAIQYGQCTRQTQEGRLERRLHVPAPGRTLAVPHEAVMNFMRRPWVGWRDAHPGSRHARGRHRKRNPGHQQSNR